MMTFRVWLHSGYHINKAAPDVIEIWIISLCLSLLFDLNISEILAVYSETTARRKQ